MFIDVEIKPVELHVKFIIDLKSRFEVQWFHKFSPHDIPD